jgi:hypothetical protein
VLNLRQTLISNEQLLVNRTRTIASVILVIGLLAGGLWFVRFGPQNPALASQGQNQPPTNSGADAIIRQEVQRLQAEHARLMTSLAAVQSENARLEQTTEQAEHAARLFKELADQSATQGQDPTNTYPTLRYVMAGIGKQNRLMADIQERWGDSEEESMAPDDEQALQHAMLVAASEIVRLRQALERFNTPGSSDLPQPSSPEAMADLSTCYLYGALQLDATQFSRINSMLLAYCQQAVQEHLFQGPVDESEEQSATRVAALDQLNAKALAEIQPLLSSRQASILALPMFKDLKLVTAKFYPPGIGFRVQQ